MKRKMRQSRPKLIRNPYILVLIIFLISFFINYLYQEYYMGNYIIQDQWISSGYNNKTYCEDCLWIKFYEGCDRYNTYYFENQHELDSRFKSGSVVNIYFNGEYIRGINLAKKYRTKC